MNAVLQGQKLFAARLLTGLVQGAALYLLHRAISASLWPATDGLVLIPLLMVFLFVPLVINQALGTVSWRAALSWAGIALLALALLGFLDAWMAGPLGMGMGHGASAARTSPSWQLLFFSSGGLFIAHALVISGCCDRRIMARYATHFDVAWKLLVQLTLVAFFVAVFWLLLWLGATLFLLIKLSFFKTLIEQAWFSTPVTALAIAGALHLTDIRPAMVEGARTLLLTLLSWLLPVIVLIVGGFVVSLPFTGLTPLWGIGHATAVLLTVIAALIILINAAYQDGDPKHTPPKLLRWSGSAAAILTAPLTVIAAYALYLRVHQYGLTPDRVTAAALVFVAAAHSAGYVFAAAVRGRWLGKIEPWNFYVSVLVLVLVVALLTPIASPARLTVANQLARLHSGVIKPEKVDFFFLRWNSGRYGPEALNRLARADDAQTRKLAQAALKATSRYAVAVPPPESFRIQATVYPRGQTLPKSFVDTKWRGREFYALRHCTRPEGQGCDALLLDLDGDGRQDVLTFSEQNEGGELFRQGNDGTWTLVGRLPLPANCPQAVAALRQGAFKLTPPGYTWKDIDIGGKHMQVREIPHPDSRPECPAAR